MGKIYLAVVQAVLLYGVDSWVVEEKNMRKLRIFYRSALRYMMGEHIEKGDGDWQYPDPDVPGEKKCVRLRLNL